MIFLKADIAVYHRCPVVLVIGSLHTGTAAHY
jgi:hypothetical protein